MDKQTSRLETIQDHYERTKAKLLVLLEKRRVKRKLEHNEESDYEEDAVGKLIKRSRVPKRTIIKNLDDIKMELVRDPLMRQIEQMHENSPEKFETDMKQYEEEQQIRFTDDDFHDASTDTSDLHVAKDSGFQTKLKYTQGESIGEPRPNPNSKWAFRKKYKPKSIV